MKKLTGKELAEYKKNIKEEIVSLINDTNLDEAEKLLLDYENSVKGDIEIYSIRAIILIKKQKYNEAEKAVLKGLKIQSNNFDLMYNLAFIKELKKDYIQAIKLYRKCKKYIVGNYELKKEIDDIILNIIEKKSSRKEITILIPTRNRPDYVKRCVNHFYSMNDENLRVCIILLDGSDEEIKEKNKKYITQLDANLIKYISYQSDTLPFERLADASRKVETEFCCTCADDDFFLKDGIIKAIDILKNNNEVGSVVGQMLRFNEGNLQQFYRGQGFNFDSIMEKDPIMRLYNFFGENELLQLVWLIYRTESLVEVLDNIDLKALNGEFQEILWFFNVVVVDKVAKIDEVLILREIANNDNTMKFIKANFYDLMVDGSFNNQYIKFKENLKAFLTRKIKSSEMFDKVQTDKHIDNIFSLYLKRWGIKNENIKIEDGKYNLKLLKEAMDLIGWDKV